MVSETIYGPRPTAGRDQVYEEKDVPRELTMLNVAITEATQVFESLAAKLHPVMDVMELTPLKESGPLASAQSPCVCPMAAGLWDLRQLVNRLAGSIVEVRDRVQL